MTLHEIAKLAGVSISTVSRVINGSARISDSTEKLVRQAMRSLDFTAKRKTTRLRSGPTNRRIAFYVLSPQTGVTPGYHHLLSGVSSGARKYELDLHVGFADDPQVALDDILQRKPAGLLLHGICPPPEQARLLKDIPTVWLMGNRYRPTWGDQVMPDNPTIGQIAAQYLWGRGHRNVFYVGLFSGWSLGMRSMGFAEVIQELGGTAQIINPRVPAPGLPEIEKNFHRLIEAYRAAKTKPTGLFVAEDWMMRGLHDTLRQAGIQPGKDLDIISCNNDRPHLQGLDPVPATIDVQFERIASIGTERLFSRMQGDVTDERIRIAVEPRLVESPAHDDGAKLASSHSGS